MIIAREKKKTNIAEYVLYMWQIEDIIRACNFDLSTIEEKIIQGMQLENIVYEETKIWYADLIDKMKKEMIEKTGHLSFVNEITEQLEELHQDFLKKKGDKKYLGFYSWAKSNIEALKNKSQNINQDDISVCLTGLYGLLVLRLRKKVISQETNEAMQTISNLMAYLSQKYHAVNKD